MLILFVLSMIFLSIAIFGFYTWGKVGGDFDGKGFTFFFLAIGITLMLFAGSDWGAGEFASEKGAFKKGVVYIVHAQVKTGDTIYAQVSQNGGTEMRAVTFNNPPPSKFTVLKDKDEKEFYLSVP